MMNKYLFHCFTSYYSHPEDAKWAKTLTYRLRQTQINRKPIRVWFDEDCVTGGDCIPEEVVAGIHSSKHLLALISKNSGQSKWCGIEQCYAYMDDPRNTNQSIIPIRLDDSPLPKLLKPFLAIDAPSGIDQSVVDKVVAAIKKASARYHLSLV